MGTAARSARWRRDGPLRILLVEDEVTIFVTLRDALTDAGHEVLGATETDAALALLEEVSPDLVLTDVRLPGAGGLAVLERALPRPSRPVLVMTGYATVEDAVEAMRLGAVDYVQKPFQNEAIVRRVEAFGAARSLRRRMRACGELTRVRGFDGIIGQSGGHASGPSAFERGGQRSDRSPPGGERDRQGALRAGGSRSLAPQGGALRPPVLRRPP